MNKLIIATRNISFLFLAFLAFQSCSEDANTYGNEQELTQVELQTILETDEIAGAADTVLAELFANNTTAGKSTNTSNDCYSTESTQTGFVVTFNNCVLNGTENINGNLTVTYEVGNESAAFTATYVDFYVGSIKVNGTRNYELTSSLDQNTISFTVTSNMTVVLEDESVISESGTKTFGFTFGENLEGSTFSLSGAWQIQANGNTYAVETTADLVGNLSCEHLTTGIMNVEKNGFSIIVDFGDGTCDNLATITLPNGNTEEVTL
ncbi:hypothetical protein FVB32_14195 [Flagellimonas hymeniacidonis]|uniref:Lipocalin-like domain-containing protein n=1 Tax=Flagellimonas hymeniacidonis TaxID=2603628 RepID=A0A5C8V2A4_9FLAO|nr:hypothetical protein [Flagellimonas hymeniacidonis]TXN35720.1 hypothetical protein FVB32_14195 [Flagellimonas hymeniacidonis]